MLEPQLSLVAAIVCYGVASAHMWTLRSMHAYSVSGTSMCYGVGCAIGPCLPSAALTQCSRVTVWAQRGSRQEAPLNQSHEGVIEHSRAHSSHLPMLAQQLLL